MRKHISEEHKIRHEKQQRRHEIATLMKSARGADLQDLASEIVSLDQELSELETTLTHFDCTDCNAPTPIREKVELTFSGGMCSRGDDPPIFLDGHVKGLKWLSCHACAVARGIITQEELDANRQQAKE
jgi:hypothetical protein